MALSDSFWRRCSGLRSAALVALAAWDWDGSLAQGSTADSLVMQHLEGGFDEHQALPDSEHASRWRADSGGCADCAGRASPGHLHGCGHLDCAPVGLADLAGLAAQVAQVLQSPLNPADDEWQNQLDTFMDVLNEGEGVDVHRLVQGIVMVPSSTPNANHEALARIAAKGTARVVTTNYDLHLEKALRSHHGGQLEVFRAPALPLGDDFEGLVYLHGSAGGESRRLVVTDRDFSLAYFHSAWAARFLQRMFPRVRGLVRRVQPLGRGDEVPGVGVRPEIEALCADR